ncbi:hypothetical protein HPB52_002081 [Rhipicephalus sanguineus]|uniref:Uncharacterized protein n=1 Tax=Rhipicephalus sanguineus TaxID=34632 RepID=A0A9D4Q4C1_RHISA|nr:hypothetical protein HPB52_002081 [Rhipicephalus sanguineus]
MQSVGHGQPLLKILRSELWRQVRLLHDRMCVVCYAMHSSVVKELRYRSIKKKTAQNTGFPWQRRLLQLPRRAKSRRGLGNLVVLDDLQVPEEVADGLKKGPKFSVPP